MSDKQSPIISVVLGSYNRKSFLKHTLESIRVELRDFPESEILVVDGGSTDGALKWLIKQKDVITIAQHNRGTWNGRPLRRRSWGYFMNLGFKCAQGKYICMISDDCLLAPGALRNGVSFFEKQLAAGKKVGALAFYWRNWPDEKSYRVGLTLGRRMFVNHGLYLKTALAEIGYADEQRYNFYHADGDLGLRMWEAGWACLDSKGSFVEHYAHAGLNIRRSNNKVERHDMNMYLERWSSICDKDNPHTLGGLVQLDFTNSSISWKRFPCWFIIAKSRYAFKKFAYYIYKMLIKIIPD